MTAPDLFPDGESGFGLELDFDDAENTSVLIVGLLIIAAAVALMCFFWFDRSGPIEQGHVVAILEQPQGGRP